MTYFIPERNLEALIAAIAKLSKRAVKLVSEPITISLTGVDRFTDVRNEDTGRVMYQIREVEISLEGSAPRLNGWQFIAAIQHDAETGRNILATVPGTSVMMPVEYRTSEPVCEHCRLSRTRKDTYIVSHEDGRFAQVGRQCLKDFTGHDDPQSIARMAELLIQAAEMCGEAGDEEWSCGGRRNPHWDLLDTVLPFTLAVIREFGWLSAGEAKNMGGISTKEKVLNWYLVPAKGDGQKAKDWINKHVTDDDHVTAAAIVEYVHTMEAGESDYVWNLQTVAQKGRCDARSIGLACSMPRCYSKELARRAERANAKDSRHFGTVGVREIFTLTVLDRKLISSEYGSSILVTFTDAYGNRAKWFSSGDGDRGMEIGTSHLVKATVKDHTEYRGILATQLTRVAVATEADLKKAAKAAAKLAKQPVSA